jgi:hypothetical protein
LYTSCSQRVTSEKPRPLKFAIPSWSGIDGVLWQGEATGMSGSRERRRQKKIEKARKKRATIQKRARDQRAAFSATALIQRAREAPFGPAWISATLGDLDGSDAVPPLVTAIVTKRISGRLLAQVLLVDCACLGVKDAFLLPLTSELELAERVADWPEEAALRPCEPLFLQSVVFHALDYARSLGFPPHSDFELALLEPRPEVLVDTPGAHPKRPHYVSGLNDDISRILAQLDATLGEGRYDFALGDPIRSGLDQLLEEGSDSTDDGEEGWEELEEVERGGSVPQPRV